MERGEVFAGASSVLRLLKLDRGSVKYAGVQCKHTYAKSAGVQVC